jgi:hypothetical protein
MSAGPAFEKISVRDESIRDLANEEYRDDTRPPVLIPLEINRIFIVRLKIDPRLIEGPRIRLIGISTLWGAKPLALSSFRCQTMLWSTGVTLTIYSHLGPLMTVMVVTTSSMYIQSRRFYNPWMMF